MDINDTALILYKQDNGKTNRRLALLSKEQGLIWATAFGAATGRRAALSNPYSLAEIKLEKKGDFLNIIDVKLSHHFNLPTLKNFYLASFFSEAIITSWAGGGDKRFFNLYNSLFTALEANKPNILPCFLIYFLHFNGLLPQAFFTDNELKLIASQNYEQVYRQSWPKQPQLLALLKKNFKLKSLTLIDEN
ncbi:MAG: recombination protein O N-terminal domain-containing protein [Spirochaetaceae bacterium]|nr:recombination protein O N-terminal domain-containing protein [Spirochaetaceae bacterium]